MAKPVNGGSPPPRDERLISDEGLNELWALTEMADRVPPHERALLALALSELAARRVDGLNHR